MSERVSTTTRARIRIDKALSHISNALEDVRDGRGNFAKPQLEEALYHGRLALADCDAAIAAHDAAQPGGEDRGWPEVSDEDVRSWANRNGFDGHSFKELRTAFEDAQTLATPPPASQPAKQGEGEAEALTMAVIDKYIEVAPLVYQPIHAKQGEGDAWPSKEQFCRIVGEALEFFWNDHCMDTGCFPADITLHNGKKNTQVEFRAGSWVRYSAERAYSQLTPPAHPAQATIKDGAAQAVALAKEAYAAAVDAALDAYYGDYPWREQDEDPTEETFRGDMRAALAAAYPALTAEIARLRGQLNDCAEALRGYRREHGDTQPCDAERTAIRASRGEE